MNLNSFIEHAQSGTLPQEGILEDAPGKQINFDSLDLSGWSFFNCTFDQCTFENCQLPGSQWNQCQLLNCDFKNSLFNDSLFIETTLKYCQSEQNQWDATEWMNSTIEEFSCTEDSFKSANFSQMTTRKWQSYSSDFSDTTSMECLFEQCSHQNLEAPRSSWLDCQMTELNCVKANLYNARFLAGSQLTSAAFDQAYLANASFAEANLTQASLNEAELSNANFSGANLQKARLNRINGERTVWVRANCAEADFYGSQLIYSLWLEADLRKADFEACNLYSADFYLATFGETHLKKSNLEQTQIEEWQPS